MPKKLEPYWLKGPVYLNLDKKYQRTNAHDLPWAKNKVLVSRRRVSRGPWRMYTNAASVLWDQRHREHTKIREFLQRFSNGPTWISVVVLGEIECGLKIVPQIHEDRQSQIRRQIAKFPQILDVNKHTIGPYSDLRAALSKDYSPRNRRGGPKMKWPEDLQERTSAKN